MTSSSQRFRLLLKVVFITPFAVSTVLAQSGGTFQITQSAIAGGGGAVGGGSFTLNGTVAQSQAGSLASAGNFSLQVGFWTSSALAPTAASVSVSGRVLTARGEGIRNVLLTLTDSVGQVRTARTGTFGFYRFDNLPAGQSYVLNVMSQRYSFGQATRFLNVDDHLADVDFTSDGEQP